MLLKIRDITTGWIAAVIVGLLIIPFAFWGINYYFGGTEPVVANVNGVDIKLSEYQRAFANYRLQMQSMLQQNLGPAEDEILKQQVLNYLVESEILKQAVDSTGLQVSDEQVRSVIKNIEVFRNDGEFNRDFYEQSVRRLGLHPTLYEEYMRIDMKSEQLQSAIIESTFITDREVEIIARLKNQERELYYTILPAVEIRDSIEVTGEEVQKYYNENQQLYRRPEQVRIAYIELSVDKLAEEVAVNEEELLDFYESNKANYDIEEQRKITQLHISINEDDSQEKIEAAKTKANTILQELKAGRTFKDITEQYKEIPEYSYTEYGFISKGIFPGPVDEVVYAMSAGDVSDIIQSDTGFHIVRLEEIKGGESNTFENARKDVELDYRQKVAEEQFFELADRLANAAFEHPDSLEIASEETGITVQQSELFSRTGSQEGILSNPVIINTSFSDEVLLNGNNSEALELTDRSIIVLRVIEHLPEARKPLDEVREEVISDIRFLRASTLMRGKGQELIELLKDGKDFPEVARDHEIEWQYVTGIKRDDSTVNRAVLRKTFSLGNTQSELPVYDGISLGTGDYAVIAVMSVNNPPVEDIEKEEITAIKTELHEQRANNDWNQMLQQLRSKSKIAVYEDKI